MFLFLGTISQVWRWGGFWNETGSSPRWSPHGSGESRTSSQNADGVWETTKKKVTGNWIGERWTNTCLTSLTTLLLKPIFVYKSDVSGFPQVLSVISFLYLSCEKHRVHPTMWKHPTSTETPKNPPHSVALLSTSFLKTFANYQVINHKENWLGKV